MSELRWQDRLKTTVRRVSPKTFEMLTMRRLAKGERSYSQEGEDRVLMRYFEASGTGFFVDIGAHDPLRFSNTYLFYRRGWRGINVDAMPGSMRLFDKYRPGDINIEMGIGSVQAELPFYMFNEPALNSFDQALSREREVGPYKIIGVINVHIRPLRDVLAPYLVRAKGVPSFLTVDVEGRDLDVLQSNDWNAFRPQFVLAECLSATVEDAAHGAVHQLLQANRYVLVAKTANTAFYKTEH